MDTTQHDDGATLSGGGSPQASRRGLLRAALAGATTLLLGGVAVRFGGPLWSRLEGPGGRQITLRTDSLPKAGADPLVNRDGKFWLINNPEGALALSWNCPHAGCIVPWNEGEKRFHCPCHSSTFDRHGVCTGGPSPRPLDLFALTVANGLVTVDTGALVRREQYEPSQATLLPG